MEQTRRYFSLKLQGQSGSFSLNQRQFSKLSSLYTHAFEANFTAATMEAKANLLLLVLSLLSAITSASEVPPFSSSPLFTTSLVQIQPTGPTYHKGQLLTGDTNLYLFWYGHFTPTQKSTVSDFITSLTCRSPPQPQNLPSVRSWWAILKSYTDASHTPPSPCFKLVKQEFDESYALGKNLLRSDLRKAIRQQVALRKFPSDTNGIYLVLTSRDVGVERFCLSSCGFHGMVNVGNRARLVMGWVGDAASQCAGMCAWPLASMAGIGPPLVPQPVAPNGDVGTDGMVMNLGAVLAGSVTNPYGSGYFQGDALAPLEAVTACAGVFGKGAYPGYPGQLFVDRKTKGSYNVHGFGNRTFLLPAIWDPKTLSCKVAG